MVKGPQIDFAKIEFPSDKLTLGTLRRMHRNQVDSGNIDLFGKTGAGSAGDPITGMLQAERDLAGAAFNRSLGRQPHEHLGDPDLKDYAEFLAEVYSQYGIASGPHHANQLIRNFESQAETLAHQHTGKRP